MDINNTQPEFVVYGVILLIMIFFIILAWTFDLLKKEKISNFFEKVADTIQDFFT